MEEVWTIMENHLFLMHLSFSIRIHAFVLMSNHFHLLVTPTNGQLSDALLYFMRETSREVTRRSGRINQTYGTRNHKTLIGSHLYFLNTYKYIYQNPIRAGVCERVEQYPYSTIHGLCGFRKLIIPIAENILFNPLLDDGAIRWLNRRPTMECEDEIARALRRNEFKLSRSKTTGEKSRLETELF